MNYKRIYDKLILKAQARATVGGYKERHHIIPKSLGGSDDKSNLVELTAREHFIAHMCLALIHGGTQWLPVMHFKGSNNSYFNSKLFEKARIETSNKMIGKTPWNKGLKGLQKWSESQRIAVVTANTGLKRTDEQKEKLRGKKTKEHAEAIRIAKLNQSAETKAKIGLAHLGKKMSESAKQKMRAAKIGTVQSKETIDKRFFAKRCNSLNKLIDSIFTPLAA